MQLRTVDDKLTLGSVYKIVVWGCLIGFSAFFIPIMLLIVIGGISAGQMSINGEMVYGSGAVFLHMLPLFVFVPIAIAVNAFMFGALIALGVSIYRFFYPLIVSSE